MSITKEQAEEMQCRVSGAAKGDRAHYPDGTTGVVVDAGHGTITVRAKALTEPRDRGMNKTEKAYSRHLEHRKYLGEVVYWGFEPVKLRIADNCFYTPDFLVITKDGGVEFHDSKAWWKSANKVGATEDSVVKMKAVAEMYPFFKILATWLKNGVWEQRVF